MNDMKKAEALKKKTGFDLEAALKNLKADQEDEPQAFEDKKERRVAVPDKANAEPARRTTTSYKVVDKK